MTIMAVLLMQGAAWAQPAADTALLDMREAFRRNNTTALTALLPRVRGHQLEPMARYWETRARLDTASPDAERLYTRGGWLPAGVVPGYALLPQGGLCDTRFFYKTLV